MTSGGSLTKAISLSGYSGKNPSAEASRIWRSPHVREAYKAALWDKLGRGAGAAINTLVALAENADSEHARLSAAEAILERSGFKLNEGLGTGGISINISLGNKQPSDQGATNVIDAECQVIDNTAQSTAIEGDDLSD